MNKLKLRFSLCAIITIAIASQNGYATLVIQDPGGSGSGGSSDPSDPVFNGFPAYHSFTSGNPPVGDGQEYPRSLNPARQVSGGVSPGTFFGSTGVAFNNLNGNPAYFDSNNLLTRPATLINNEAFWTDPKIGQFRSSSGSSFELAQFGFNFLSGFTTGADFGFDLAMASVSTDLPTGSFYDDDSGGFITAPFLPFQIQDDNFLTARGTLVFANGSSGGSEDSLGVIYAEQVGTFPTLNSPRTAYEARFRIDESQLREFIEYENDFGFEENSEGVTSGPIEFFDIDLEEIATFGGTTQIAMDNFVLAGAPVIGDTLREPLTIQPFDPVGKNRPQYFKTGDDNPFGDEIVTAILGSIPEIGGLEIDIPVDATPLSDGSQTINTTIYVPGNSGVFDEGNEGPLGGVSAAYDDPPPLPTVVLLPEEVSVGGYVEFESVTVNGIQKTGTIVVETTNRSSGLLGNIASNLSDGFSSGLNIALQDLGVSLEELGADEAIPLTGEQLGGMLSGLLGGGASPSLDEVIDGSTSSSGASGLLGSIAKNLSGIDGELDRIGQQLGEPIRQLIEAGDPVTPGLLNGLFDGISQELSNVIGSSIAEEFELQDQQVFDSLSNMINQIQNASGKASSAIRMVEVPDAEPMQMQVEAFSSVVSTIIEQAESQYYVNYSYNEYVALLASLGEDQVVGDSGGFVEPIFDASGQVIDFQFSSWIVTDGSGTYTTAVALFSNSAVPEPSTAVLLLSAVGLTASRKKRK